LEEIQTVVACAGEFENPPHARPGPWSENGLTLLRPGQWADVTVFDAAKVIDHATYEKPHQLSVGVSYVFVNGTMVLKNGKPTEAKPGRIVRGPGYRETN